MTNPKMLLKWLLALTCVWVGVAASAADPSMAQIYQAAEAGQLAQAQTMIQQVLQDHPGSAKAHYVHAELLARQNQLPAARNELKIAEQLAPGLPFAKASAVMSLRTQIAATPRIGGLATLHPSVVSRGPGILLPMLVLAGILMAGYFFFRARNRTGASAWNDAGVPSPAIGSQPYAPTMPAVPPASGGGIGSTMLGGLAAGAAAGAGMVAGQALMHRILDGNNTTAAPLRTVEPPWNSAATDFDMGGDNFGITDAGSWDDAGSGGGNDSDWN